MAEQRNNRRTFIATLAAGACGVLVDKSALATSPQKKFSLRYLLGSSLYGYMPLEKIVPEVTRSGAVALDIWPMIHGNQREQLEQLGEDHFTNLLKKNGTSLGCITQYKLGPFNLREEMKVAKRLGCKTIVTGIDGPKGLSGGALKSALRLFVEKMKPHMQVAEELGIDIAIENHAGKLLDSEESIKWFIEYSNSKNMGLALAPYHLPQEEKIVSDLIGLSADKLMVFYAWQHGEGSMQQQPREREQLQLPGRGKLDFKPIIEALKKIKYTGWTEIFMHAYPRGSAMMDTAEEVTAQINFSRKYLENCLAQV